MSNESASLLTQLNNWLKESVMVKVVCIGILVLFLLIPQAWVSSIMEERQGRVSEVIAEVSDKWSGEQKVTGPVLVLPYKKQVISKVMVNGKLEDRVVTTTEKAYFLPQNLDIKAMLDPEMLHRGIFDVVVYNSQIGISGHFEKPNLAVLGIKPENVYWNEAYLITGLSDQRGIGETPKIEFGGRSYDAEPVNKGDRQKLFEKNIAADVKVDSTGNSYSFNMKIALKGSSKLYFYPMGKSTAVNLDGNWGNPKFNGFYLPEKREIINDAFSASWKVLNFNRSFPQQWTESVSGIEETAFGVDLIVPVDQYQKSTRTSKYGILIIVLTFVSLLLIEVIVKRRVHPFQYILIGVALTIYYTLLLSLSEHLGFNVAYLISSLAVIALISLYSLTFFRKTSISALLGGLLFVFYAYIFVITQQQDYALLLGSVGLFLIVSVLMYVSRKVSWYGEDGPGINKDQQKG
jgi:inner membrane protein